MKAVILAGGLGGRLVFKPLRIPVLDEIFRR